MSKKTVEIYLKSLIVKEAGDKKSKPCKNILTISMLYSDYPVLPAVRDFKLKDNEPVDFQSGMFNEFDRLLYKTEINHYVWLRVNLVHVNEPSVFDKFFGSLVGGLANLILGAFGDWISKPVSKLPFDSSSGQLTGKLGKISEKLIGIGHYDLKIESGLLPDSGKSHQFNIPLIVPNKVTVKEWDPDLRKKEPTSKEVTLLEKGANNGELILTVNIL